MPFRSNFEKVLTWVAKNERPLGALLFAFGFLTDIFTFGLLPVGIVNIFFLSYLVLAAVCTFGTHLISVYRERDVWWRKVLSVLFPLGAQYALGGLLSGFVVFYTKSSVVSVSWPFLLLLALVYGGNEYFRKHKDHLIFQTALFFFALYAYAIFALPLVFRAIGPWIFIGSTVVAILAFAAFLYVLRRVNQERFNESVRPIVIASAGIVIAVSGSYFTGLIPPIPLTLSHVDVYHELTHTSAGYLVRTEAVRSWWDILPRTVHHAPGTPLYVLSAVAAPVKFSATVTHEWEYYTSQGEWELRSKVSFPITGGRSGGYRGYSLSENPEPGKWRVTIRTGAGQVIGRLRFIVEDVPQVLLTRTETL